MRRRWIWIAPLAIVGIVAFIAIGGVIVMLLWNWLLPPLFGWPTILFWQALGLLALCRILFGGCGFRGTARSGVRGHIADHVTDHVTERMTERVAERMERMTPEERERLRERLRERFGLGPSAGETKGP